MRLSRTRRATDLKSELTLCDRYTRRKASSACFNGDDFERSNSVEVCACQASDFECDFGFEKRSVLQDAPVDAEGDWCVRQAGLPPLSFGPPKECSAT